VVGVNRRSYSGRALDGTVQYITERPALDDDSGGDETVYATEPEPSGEETTENVPTPESAPGDGPPENVHGQTTLDDWRWSP
jgi:hypothetical protein